MAMPTAVEHTPGPWTSSVGPYGSCIDSPSGRVATHIVWEQDARLIAAAPLLAEAVMAALEYCCGARRDLPEISQQLWTAYAAASGEGSEPVEAPAPSRNEKTHHD